MTRLSVATWNINSVRLRAGLVKRFVEEHRPDVVCLQEIKCRDGEFPSAIFAEMGLPHLHIRGQKGWHGVAIASRLPLESVEEPNFCRHGEARVAAVRVAGVTIHNLYVPAGGDEPDTAINPKFDHKLSFLDRMEAHYRARNAADPLVVVGDLNVAPGEHDVWGHKQLLNVVSHTPVETEALGRIIAAGDLVDLGRVAVPASEKLFSWWSYRSPDWTKNDRGRRLDHIWANRAFAPCFVPETFVIHKSARAWEKPSDHVPVVAAFEV
ncbi:exodeoxyribonuclease III [Candidatus Phycosocius bacilliformis]|uniref:Exodeoxyribonuclease III n=1 Tax=Candidatus Phycosocius bacilliformis TaxID=1445552 RepID=A0A2P2E6Y0_9PROT|nr:exodeoxyribonuclease III [Candidatus Phycosocius bacilliformis]GBF56808.1 exodeoxyribonuclease III [Candidatus Phycosocius bacilliformis]